MSAELALPLRVDVVSDVVCPWCIIGYLQFQKALAQLPGQFEVELHWQPFELNPQMPEEGQDLREHIAQKYGATPEQSGGARQRLTELGDKLGFHFDYFEGMRMVNTFKAHQLLHWAEGLGLQVELKLALFKAFFNQRENVGDVEQLAAAAARVGLDQNEALAVLADQRFADSVRQQQALWLERDVHAVPMFYFQHSYGVPGAQEAETFVRVLSKLRAKELAGIG
ncbi:MAG: putative DsbA family dithiol-disulfide isomerase [Alcanivorax sp.]|jgi:predicted DsbA family dithiol-disulfide isomerase